MSDIIKISDKARDEIIVLLKQTLRKINMIVGQEIDDDTDMFTYAVNIYILTMQFCSLLLKDALMGTAVTMQKYNQDHDETEPKGE